MWEGVKIVQWLSNNGTNTKAKGVEQGQVYIWHICVYLHSIFLYLFRLFGSLLSKHMDVHSANEDRSDYHVGNNTVDLLRPAALPTHEGDHRYYSIYEYTVSW